MLVVVVNGIDINRVVIVIASAGLVVLVRALK